jgi:MFS family permease
MLVAPFAGRLLDQYPVRRVMMAAAIVLGLSFAGIAVSPSLWIMAVILLLPAALACMCLGFLNTSTLASRWFYRHRGLAMGIAAVATSGGGFTVVPLLSAAIQHHGWRQALLYEACAIVLIIVVLALVVRDRPSDLGLDTHPENQGRGQAAAVVSDSRTWRDIFATRAFWVPALTIAAISGTSQAVVITLAPYSIQNGVTPAAAALLISAFALAAAITKVLSGLLADHINKRYLLIAAAAFMTLSWLTLSLFTAYGALFAGSCLAGVALGCALPTVAGLIAGSFGSVRFGRVMGWAYALTLGLSILSVRFVGFMYDRFAGYHLAFECFAGLLTCLLVMTLLFAPERRAA